MNRSILRQGISLAALGTLAISVAGQPSFAKTRMYCTQYTESGTVKIDDADSTFGSGGGCHFTSMPLYNQKSTQLPSSWMPGGDYSKSMLCGPTAAAMAISAITMDGLSYYMGSWTQTKITYKPWTERVINMANYMDTSVTGGTSGAIGKYADREEDIVNATRSTRDADDGVINPTYAKDRIGAGVSPIMSYGRYTKKCENLLFFGKVCTYDRTGGHVIAINGTYQDAYGTYFKIYDPVGPVSSTSLGSIAYRRAFTVPTESGAALDLKPHGSNTRHIKYSNSVYRILDSFGGVNTNAE